MRTWGKVAFVLMGAWLLLAGQGCEPSKLDGDASNQEVAQETAGDSSGEATDKDLIGPDSLGPDGSEVSPNCPAQDPLGVESCEGPAHCEYGQECCCGSCYPSLVCNCEGGHWACYYTDACMIPPDYCEDVAQPDVVEGQEEVADVVDDDTPPHPTGCCDTPGDCPQGSVCLGLEFGAPGTCWPIPTDGGCFFDADCAEGERCLGEHQTNCMMSSLPWEGECVKGPDTCCESDLDCEPGYVCGGAAGWGPGECLPRPPEGQCYTDLQCGPWESCVGGGACGCLVDCEASGPGTCQPVGGCCHSNDDCEYGTWCLGAELGAGGTCFNWVEDGDCFYDADCGAGMACWGADVCSCDMNCISVAGQCYPLYGDCCHADLDCPQGLICAGEGPGGWAGVCKLPAAPLGQCWDDQECPAWATCQGAAICPCDADCDMADMPGTCKWAPDCCTASEQCANGQYCVDLFPTADTAMPGACKPILQPGACWTFTDCAADETCMGAVPCPCGYDVLGDGCDIPGTCKKKSETGCCNTDADCPGGMCLPQTHTCVEELAFGECFSDSDCGMSQECQGASFCPCGLLCILGTMPGKCAPLPTGCCYADADCGEWEVCRGTSGTPGDLPGSCVPSPLGPQCMGDAACCWQDSDCPGASKCTNAYVCGCIELCPVCGACAEDQMGFCGN
jgi:hypothetical protein